MMHRGLMGCALVITVGAAVAGCASAPVVEIDTRPALVCPGDTVTLFLRSLEGHSGGRLTSTPPVEAGSGSTLIDSETSARAYDRDLIICETTRFDAVFWNGEETACGENYTTCVSATASVAFGDVPVMRSSTTCGERAEFTISEDEFGSLKVREIQNCTGGSTPRDVEVTAPDGTVAMIPGGGSSTAFSGQDLVGIFRARRTIVPPERCPPEFEVVPGPTPPAPPPICLVFIAGCDETGDCG